MVYEQDSIKIKRIDAENSLLLVFIEKLATYESYRLQMMELKND